ncbi:MAG: hypothetical protein ABIJ16_13260 [Bacteroidota bacterium]
MNGVLRDIEILGMDNTTGSTGLLRKYIQILISFFEKEKLPSQGVIQDILSLTTDTFCGFIVFRHFTGHFKDAIDAGNGNFLQITKDYMGKWGDADKEAAGRAFDKLKPTGETVLLHSHSSTLIRFVEHAVARDIEFRIIQTESRPACEGRMQAVAIAKMGIHADLIPEADIPWAVASSAYCICGADIIHNDFVINKTGSLLIALTCRHFCKPFYIIADERKRSGTAMPLNERQEMPGDEIWDNAPAKVKPVNRYFEAIPAGLITRVFT